MGTYTPNYNLYMPEVGETGWGQLVSNNFAIIDGMDKIDSITTTFTVLTSTTVNIDSSYITYDSTTVSSYAYVYGSTSALIPSNITITPSQSCRYFLIYINGDLTINGNINTYPTTLRSETPPNSPETNTLNIYRIGDLCNSLTTLISKTGTSVTMDIQEPYLGAYLDFYSRKTGITTDVILTIPHAIAEGGNNMSNGISGTAENTCNGGGGGGYNPYSKYSGGTGCIFGQYTGGIGSAHGNGYGYGDVASNKYRCALIFVVNGNLTINNSCTITQIGGNGSASSGGYGGGAYGNNEGGAGGGGGAPVFIYYTGSYVNNGTINVNGGNKSTHSSGISGGNGGAGGIKITKISI